jgi:lipid-A-disaccharide synthase
LRQTIHAVISAPPDVLVLIDAPDFTHRVGKRVRQALPRLPIVKYVSPTVWAWRPGRAPAMRRWCDLVLALFPFEPEAHRRLGGPPCMYVGHPLLERLEELRPSPEEANARFADPPLVLALPGSRRQEVTRLGPVFGDALGLLAAQGKRFELVLATLPHLAPQITEIVSTWPVRPRIVTAEAEKYVAFRRARGAIAASGTVTLELALAQVPHVAAYRVPLVDEAVARIAIRAGSIILANLVLGDKVVPELLQRRCTARNLARALADVVDESPARRSQIEAFRRLDAVLGIGGRPPSERAARAVLDLLRQY